MFDGLFSNAGTCPLPCPPRPGVALYVPPLADMLIVLSKIGALEYECSADELRVTSPMWKVFHIAGCQVKTRGTQQTA